MTTQTKLSAKGQVVIPKDVRDRLGLSEGTVFDVFERGEEVVFKRQPGSSGGLTAADALRQIQALYHYDGPPLSLEAMREAAHNEAVKNHLIKHKQ